MLVTMICCFQNLLLIRVKVKVLHPLQLVGLLENTISSEIFENLMIGKFENIVLGITVLFFYSDKYYDTNFSFTTTI